MIDLVNRRFVPFFYSIRGQYDPQQFGEGGDAAAAELVGRQPKNGNAFLAVFTPDGKLVGESELYADKDQVFEFLRGVLASHPVYAHATDEEAQVIAAAGEKTAGLRELVRAAGLFEELGDYVSAKRGYEAASVHPDGDVGLTVESSLAIARLLRREGALEGALGRLESIDLSPQGELSCSDRIALERGLCLIGQKKYGDSLEGLERAIRAHPESTALGELRFYAGKAAWFAGDRERAYYHWCWVCENIPEDKLRLRCYIAAANEGHPYPNFEIGRPEHLGPGCSYGMIDAAYAKALEAYEKLASSF